MGKIFLLELSCDNNGNELQPRVFGFFFFFFFIFHFSNEKRSVRFYRVIESSRKLESVGYEKCFNLTAKDDR